MGFGKSLKKAVKKVTKQATSAVQSIVNDPFSKEGLESAAGIAASPLTGGGSLALTADAGRRTEKKASSEEDAAASQAALVEKNKQQYGFGSMAELVEARKKKEAELAGREQTRVSGISSLIGRGSTLG